METVLIYKNENWNSCGLYFDLDRDKTILLNYSKPYKTQIFDTDKNICATLVGCLLDLEDVEYVDSELISGITEELVYEQSPKARKLLKMLTHDYILKFIKTTDNSETVSVGKVYQLHELLDSDEGIDENEILDSGSVAVYYMLDNVKEDVIVEFEIDYRDVEHPAVYMNIEQKVLMKICVQIGRLEEHYIQQGKDIAIQGKRCTNTTESSYLTMYIRWAKELVLANRIKDMDIINFCESKIKSM